MSKSNLHENAYLKLVFQNIAMANIGDASGIQPSAGAGELFIALYTTDPNDTDSGTEANYTAYERVGVPRSVIGWAVVANVASNVGDVVFPVSLGVDNSITHWGIRTALTGGDLIGSGSLTGVVAIITGDTPRFNAGTISITED
jgi:hypothetical protein